MKVIALATAVLAMIGSLAAAQESAGDDLWEPSSYRAIGRHAEPEPPVSLPASLVDPLPSLSIGPAVGYLNVRGADRGTWFAGAQARLRFGGVLAAEAAITFHSNEYENGDVIVTQYPFQLTAMLVIIPAGPIRPYILGGVGWYYTRIDYRGLFAAIPDKTDHLFGVHLGGGAELMLGPNVGLNADVRYIFLNADNEQVIRRDFNYWQVTAGLNLYF